MALTHETAAVVVRHLAAKRPGARGVDHYLAQVGRKQSCANNFCVKVLACNNNICHVYLVMFYQQNISALGGGITTAHVHSMQGTFPAMLTWPRPARNLMSVLCSAQCTSLCYSLPAYNAA